MNDNTLLPVLGSRTQGDLLACSASTESFRESKELILHIFLDRGPQDTKEFPDLFPSEQAWTLNEDAFLKTIRANPMVQLSLDKTRG